MSYMAEEIAQQPDVIEANAKSWQEQADGIRSRAGDRKTLVFVGRGSSGNACTFANYLYAQKTGRQAVVLRPWVTVQETPEADWSDAWVLAYSASGQSTDVAHAARWLRQRGAYVAGVTNAPNTSCHLGEASQDLLLVNAGLERAVPATKSLGAQFVASAALCGVPIVEAAKEIADCMREILAGDTWSQLASFLSDTQLAWWIARGPAQGAALDAALKVMESAAIPGTAWSAAEVLHGPIGSASPEHRGVFFIDHNDPASSLDAATAAFVARGVPVLRIGAAGEGNGLSIPLPKERWARTPVFALLAQRAALALAQMKGLDPDSPEGLAKITNT